MRKLNAASVNGFNLFRIGLACSAALACGAPADERRQLITMSDLGDVGELHDGEQEPEPEPPDVLEPARVRAQPYLGFPLYQADREQAPLSLSETGAFLDVAALEPAPGLLPYGVVSPLWSDGASKSRWLALPEGESIGFDPEGAFAFPPGTVLVKHFGVALDERQPDVLERMETRFLIADADGLFYGVSYRYNPERTDATRVDEGVEEELTIVQADGSERTQTYSYPGPGDCGRCHSEGAGYALSPRASQLHRDYEYASAGASEVLAQLDTWNDLGLFEPPVDPAALEALPRLAELDDESRSLEDRVRSYWDGNCNSCHNEQASFPSWLARYGVPLDQQNVLDAVPMRGEGEEGLRLIAPGDVSRSFMHQRVSSLTRGLRMPPLATYRVDERFVDVLGRWIESLPAD